MKKNYSSDKDKQYINADKRSIFDKFLDEVKISVFSVLFVLLKEDSGGILYFALENLMDYIQMHEFIFNDKINSVWKADEVLTKIFDIISFFEISQYFGSAFNWGVYIATFYACIIGILLVVIDIFYVAYSFKRKRFSMLWPLHLLRNVVDLIVSVFFLPITEVLISIVECETDEETGKRVHSSFPEVECWKGFHIMHALLGLIVTTILVTIAIVVA